LEFDFTRDILGCGNDDLFFLAISTIVRVFKWRHLVEGDRPPPTTMEWLEEAHHGTHADPTIPT